MTFEWAEEWLRSFSTAGLGGAMAEMYAEDVEFQDMTLARTARGVREVETFFRSLLGPEAGKHRFTATAYRGDASGGAVEWLWEATHGRDLFGVPARGKTTRIRGVSVLGFRDGKIVTQHDYWDAASVLQQLKT